jgi:hypothetical protein
MNSPVRAQDKCYIGKWQNATDYTNATLDTYEAAAREQLQQLRHFTVVLMMTRMRTLDTE